jgi:hypothetical protein
LGGDAGGFHIADFADEDDVGVLSEEGAEGGGEGQVDGGVDLDLGDTWEAVFDGVFYCDDIESGAVDMLEDGVERGGFAGAGGAGDEEDAIGGGDDLFEGFEVGGGEVEVFELGDGVTVGGAEDTEDDFFSIHGGDTGEAEVDFLDTQGEGEAAVLGAAVFGDIATGHEFKSCCDGGFEVLVEVLPFVEFSIDPESDAEAIFFGFEVDIAGAFADSDEEEVSGESDDVIILGEVDEVLGAGVGVNFGGVFPGEVGFEFLNDVEAGEVDFDGFEDFVGWAEDGGDVGAEDLGCVVDGGEVEGVGCGDCDGVIEPVEGDDLV